MRHHTYTTSNGAEARMIGYTIRMSDVLRKRIRVAAAEDDKSMNQWIVAALSANLNHRRETMNYYAIIENHSGYLWEITQAPNPVTACRQVDAHITPDATHEYVPVFAHELAANDTGFHVFELDRATFDSLRDADGQDDEAIQTVNDHGELVATYKFEERES